MRLDRSIEAEEEKPSHNMGCTFSDEEINYFSSTPMLSSNFLHDTPSEIRKNKFLSSWNINMNYSLCVVGMEGLVKWFSVNLKKLLGESSSSSSNSDYSTSSDNSFLTASSQSIKPTFKKMEDSNILLYVSVRIYFGGSDLLYNKKYEMLSHFTMFSFNPKWNASLQTPLLISQIPAEARISFTLFAQKATSRKDVQGKIGNGFFSPIFIVVLF
jgi:hypothetical protein